MPTESINAAYHRIRSLRVNGGFLDGFKIDFADNLNCLIGGRGTGKTTIIEFLRWALDHITAAGNSQRIKAIEKLVQANLGTGQIDLEIETLHGINYQVRRAWADETKVLNENGDIVEIDLGKGSIFSVEIYSQNQIEDIANDPLFQLKLLDKFVAEEISEADIPDSVMHSRFGNKLD